MNHFTKNRHRVQVAIAKDYIKPILDNGNPYEIIEKENFGKPGKLKKVTITNLPVSTTTPTVFEVNLELAKNPFSGPSHEKKTERALLVFTAKRLQVLFIEMKSRLSPFNNKSGGLLSIENKLIGSLTRVSILLNHYYFDDANFSNYPIVYSFIVLYNDHDIHNSDSYSPMLQDVSLAKKFHNPHEPYWVRDSLEIDQRVEVIFKQNPNNTEEFEIDLNEIFRDKNFHFEMDEDKTLPLITI